MKTWIGTYKLYLAGALVGALGGFLYWKFVGCVDGTCAITSSPWKSTAYFAVMGAVFFGLFRKSKPSAQAK